MTDEEFVAFVDRVGFCSWQRFERLPGLPSLEEESGWSGHDLFNQTWFWKDDLHIERRLYYGQILAAGVPVFVSNALLPLFVAAQGDNDPRTLYEQNRLPRAAVQIYEHVEREGPTPSNRLPVSGADRQRALIALQRPFLLTKAGLTGRGRGTYGYIWDRCEAHFPDVFTEAARLSVARARAGIRERLLEHVDISEQRLSKLLHWHDG
ncbi:MAG TPA: hypothetical protein VM490_03225 [Armatimonadaceae bacterium]|nr:hypothetical protein [Armatimonadaceae bacterium]